MNQEQSIALWRQGKDAWNGWAADMLRQKSELEKAGTWNGDKSQDEWLNETRAWIEAASVNLQSFKFMDWITEYGEDNFEKMHKIEMGEKDYGYSVEFVKEHEASFSEFIFPWVVDLSGAYFDIKVTFVGAQFHALATFSHTQFHKEALFGIALFHGEAGFDRAQFHRQAGFWGAQFHGDAGFEDAQFHGEARFQGAQFHRDALFMWTTYETDAQFEDSQFYGGAGFWGAQFSRRARFKGAQFGGEAWFADTTFKGGTSFRGAKFGDGTQKNYQNANFTGIKVERGFVLAKAEFSRVPAFNQADFVQAPDLDDVQYPFPPFFRFWVRGWEDAEKTVRRAEKFKADAAKYRHLRRLAILGHDHENEGKAFKGETRAKRGTEHRPWLAAFWFGLFYDALSDFGRSMMRPFYAWAVLTALFALLYFARSDAPTPWACSAGAKGIASHITAWGEAGYLAIKNGLIVIGLGSEGKINQAHACLYGGTIQEPVFPSGLSIWQIVQNFLSAPLIFLFLLGVRNNFKIK